MIHRIKITLNKRGSETENLPIRIRVTFGGVRLDLATGYTIDLKKWDAAKNRAKQGVSNEQGYSYSQINKGLSDREEFINAYFTKSDLDGKNPSDKELKETYNIKFSVWGKATKETKTFFTYFDEFVQTRGRENSWTEDTFEKFRAVKKHLQTHNSKMSFAYLDEKGLAAYLDYLKEKMSNETIKRQLEFLRWFLRWATDKGYNSNMAFMTFKPKIKTVENKIIALTEEELMRVWNFEIPEGKNYLQHVRDTFCFCAFTSLRYSDLKNLKRANVKENQIEITTIKTNDSLVIDLNKYSKTILEKYAEIPFENDRALPVISNQKMNDYIKELGALCEINEPITWVTFKGNERIEEVLPKHQLLSTHCGRRTFISLAIAKGIPPHVIMKFTGHADYKAMKPYIEIADKSKAAAMKIFDEL